MHDFPIYNDIDSPMTGLMFIGHDIDPNAEDVRGQIIQSITDAMSMDWVFKERPAECAAIVSELLTHLQTRNNYCRHVLWRHDDEGEELPDVHFSLTGPVPEEHDGYEENVRYNYCGSDDEHAQAVTVCEWGIDAAENADKCLNDIWGEEVEKKRTNKGPEGGKNS